MAESDVHRVVDAQAEVAGQDRTREAHGERGIGPAGGHQGPHVSAELEVHGVREHAVHPAGSRRAQVDDRPDSPGGDPDAGGHESAAIILSESDTQPKMAPWALIISSPTRLNSGKYDATQSDSTTHS